MALGEAGIKENPNRAPFPFLGYLDPREGQGFDVEDPMKLAWRVLYLFTPGSLQAGAIGRAVDEPDLGSALLRANGFGRVAGHQHPQRSTSLSYGPSSDRQGRIPQIRDGRF